MGVGRGGAPQPVPTLDDVFDSLSNVSKTSLLTYTILTTHDARRMLYRTHARTLHRTLHRTHARTHARMHNKGKEAESKFLSSAEVLDVRSSKRWARLPPMSCSRFAPGACMYD